MEAHETQATSPLSQIACKLFVMSGKGGVGKSSIAVNLAAALAAKGKRVGILDVDIYGSSIGRLLGFSDNDRIVDRDEGAKPRKVAERLYALSMESLLKDPDQAVMWRGPMKTSAIRRFLNDTDWGPLDYLVVDSPPGAGEEHMTVLKTIPDALCIEVTTPQEVSLDDVRNAVTFLQYAQANILGLVENMSGLICPHCDAEIPLFKKGGGRKLAEKYGLPYLGDAPLDPTAVVAGDLGKPIVSLDEDSPAKDALISLAHKVDEAASRSLEILSTAHT